MVEVPVSEGGDRGHAEKDDDEAGGYAETAAIGTGARRGARPIPASGL